MRVELVATGRNADLGMFAARTYYSIANRLCANQTSGTEKHSRRICAKRCLVLIGGERPQV